MIESTRRKWFALGAPLGRPVHGRARHRDRERRASVDPDRPRVLAGEPPVGRERLRALLRWLPPARRAGSPTSIGRRRLFIAGLITFTSASLVSGLAWSEGVADRGPRVPGPRRGAHHSRRTLDPDRHLQGREGTERGARRLGRRRRVRRCRRRAAGRRPHGRVELGVDLLRQHPRRDHGARARADSPLGEPRRDREELRRSWCGARDESAGRARLRDHAGEQLRLELDRDDRPVHRRDRAAGGVPRLGGADEPTR